MLVATLLQKSRFQFGVVSEKVLGAITLIDRAADFAQCGSEKVSGAIALIDRAADFAQGGLKKFRAQLDSSIVRPTLLRV